MTVEVNGKSVHIPDAEIKNSMTMLDLTKEEAIQMWLEDNDYAVNETVEILTAKAKENKVSRGAKSEKSIAKSSPKARERKPDLEKEEIITALSEFLQEKGYISVEITNKSKIIEFNIGENHYKLDLIRQRAQKKS
jgi:hypothetical protein